MMENVIKTRKGRDKFLHEGRLYVFHKISADKQTKFWRCQRQADPEVKCKGRIHTTKEGEVLKTMGEHNCVQSAANVELQRLVTSIKRRATETIESAQTIWTQMLQQAQAQGLQNVPSKDATNKIVKRVRREVINVIPPFPANVQLLTIPDHFKLYKESDDVVDDQGENFLLADSGVYQEEGQCGPQRILIFGRQSFSAWAQEMKHCYVDTTIPIKPTPFSNVCVVMARQGHWVLPMLFALVTDLSEVTYRRLFELIKAMWPEFEPDQFSLDFDMAAVHGVKACFPATQIDFCLIHMVHALERKVQELGLQQRFSTDADFSIKARMITSLAFMPLCDLTHAIWALEEQLPQELQPLFDWFLTTFTGRPMWNGSRTVPMFAPDAWSQYQRALDAGGRMDHAEVAHRRLQCAFRSGRQQSIWHFLTALKAEQRHIDANFSKCILNKPPPPRPKRCREAEARICRIVKGYVPVNAVMTTTMTPDGHQNYQPQPQNQPLANPQAIVEFLLALANNYEMKQH